MSYEIESNFSKLLKHFYYFWSAVLWRKTKLSFYYALLWLCPPLSSLTPPCSASRQERRLGRCSQLWISLPGRGPAHVLLVRAGSVAPPDGKGVWKVGSLAPRPVSILTGLSVYERVKFLTVYASWVLGVCLLVWAVRRLGCTACVGEIFTVVWTCAKWRGGDGLEILKSSRLFFSWTRGRSLLRWNNKTNSKACELWSQIQGWTDWISQSHLRGSSPPRGDFTCLSPLCSFIPSPKDLALSSHCSKLSVPCWVTLC